MTDTPPAPPASTRSRAREMLAAGDLAPWFMGKMLGEAEEWSFASAGGAAVLLFFMGTASDPKVAAAHDCILARAALFDDVRARFFGVTADPRDAPAGRIARRLPGIRYFLDYGMEIARRFGTADDDGQYRPHLLVLDRRLHVAGRFGLGEVDAALELLALEAGDVGQDWAPVLTMPNLFEQSLCRDLIAYYDCDGGSDSGFMRDIDGKTTLVTDHSFKRRRDALIEDLPLQAAIRQRIERRLVPTIRRALQFNATRIERYVVSAYDAGAGFFGPHRDNTTRGTAHRRLAVTINLNDDYDGGDLRFPEFGTRTYRAPPGGAVVFSCALLHEATPVTRGRRYACLPFLYDEEAARIREANQAHLADNSNIYVANPSGEQAQM
ncbi:2OG-Fe(II) oxygenase [Sphingomonas sp.]|uniref:2OG-Fe(II) oxygenase family protein n=1 Tax=Sphingomonas sp. TaxID=28214 RepID=UPI002C9CB91B|nr:2OG-Fe(II) oxygenase [Sphingomonas sp.]HWK35618.1 2OG-Fe(II) oxygenase [Sphingomonas sp.]